MLFQIVVFVCGLCAGSVLSSTFSVNCAAARAE